MKPRPLPFHPFRSFKSYKKYLFISFLVVLMVVEEGGGGGWEFVDRNCYMKNNYKWLRRTDGTHLAWLDCSFIVYNATSPSLLKGQSNTIVLLS